MVEESQDEDVVFLIDADSVRPQNTGFRCVAESAKSAVQVLRRHHMAAIAKIDRIRQLGFAPSV
jgi:hypothetical protein